MFDLQYFIEFYQALVYQSFMHKIYGTYCAALTPINSDRSINKELFLNHCKHLLAEGVDGFVQDGTHKVYFRLWNANTGTILTAYPDSEIIFETNSSPEFINLTIMDDQYNIYRNGDILSSSLDNTIK